jgi:hypothetical protein
VTESHRPAPEQVVEGYDVLFDPLMRAAHRAALEYATVTREDRWPTPSIVFAFASLYDVPAAELGAFFGLLSYRNGDRTLWVDAVRGPVSPALAEPYLSRGQSVAFGFMRCAVAPGKCR